MSVREERELLIVDGYNVHATARCEGLIDGANQADGLVSSADAAYHMDGDPLFALVRRSFRCRNVCASSIQGGSSCLTGR